MRTLARSKPTVYREHLNPGGMLPVGALSKPECGTLGLRRNWSTSQTVAQLALSVEKRRGWGALARDRAVCYKGRAY
jgi:hypothetical protein